MAKNAKISTEMSIVLPWEGLNQENELWPKQLIFISFDIKGSTRLKTSVYDAGLDSNGWFAQFGIFLQGVASEYKKYLDIAVITCKHMSGCSNCADSAKIRAWKYIGDEVVLVGELTCKASPPLFANAIKMTANSIHTPERNIINKRYVDENGAIQTGSTPVRVQSTAWVAGFPLENKLIKLPFANSSDCKADCRIVDYLGTSIDLGFRLTDYASDDRIIISGSLAYLITQSGENRDIFPLYTGGLVHIPGVKYRINKTDKHPLIWHPLESSCIEKNLCVADMEKIEHFLQHVYFKDCSTKPFILDKDTNMTSVEMQSYIAEYNKIVTGVLRNATDIDKASDIIQAQTDQPEIRNENEQGIDQGIETAKQNYTEDIPE